MIRIALADDQVLFRRGMALLLRDMDDVQVAFECSNGKELLIAMRDNPVDIVLLDVEMPVMGGLEAMHHLNAEHPGVKVVMLSMHEGDEHIVQAMELGANAYVVKTAEPQEIEDTIRGVDVNGYHFNDRVSKVMLHGLIQRKKVKPIYKDDIDPLTERELEVLIAICQELTTTEIAGQLFLSPRTVEGHRNKILLKTGARNTAGLVVYALTKGIYTP